MRNGIMAVGSAVAPALAMTTTAMAFAYGGAGAHFDKAHFGGAVCRRGRRLPYYDPYFCYDHT